MGRNFTKFILPGNEVQPGVWEAEEPEWLAKIYHYTDMIEICTHRDFVPGEISDEEDRCLNCGATYKDGKWQR